MSIYNANSTAHIPKETVYLLLKKFGLYDEMIEDIIYHLNIKYLPYSILMKFLAPSLKLNARQSATFIYNTIKFCDEKNTSYNKVLDERITRFGTSYGINDDSNDFESFDDGYNEFMNSSRKNK